MKQIQNNNINPQKRNEIIRTLLSSYLEVFHFTENILQDINIKLLNLDENELMYELTILGEYYNQEMQVYQKIYREAIRKDELTYNTNHTTNLYFI